MTPAHDPSIAWDAWEARFATFVAEASDLADAAHDPTHLARVVATAKRLAAAEHAQLAVVVPAAWLHDCVHVPKNSPERSRASTLAAIAASEFLHHAGYPAQYIGAIEHAIAAHSFSAGIAPRTLEAQVVQDADRLDAIGAIGVARCLMLGSALGRALYAADAPFPTQRPPDDTRYTIDHFYTKLLTIAHTMQTAAGRHEAADRLAFMQHFLAQLGHEIGAE